jgi:hypothetical protein
LIPLSGRFQVNAALPIAFHGWGGMGQGADPAAGEYRSGGMLLPY